MRNHDPEHIKIVQQGGGEFVGYMEGTLHGERIFDDLILFNSPKTGSTLAIPEKQLTAERVSRRIVESNRAFGK